MTIVHSAGDGVLEG